MQLDRILRLNDLFTIQEAIVDAGYGEDKLEITLKVRAVPILQQINVDLFYKENNEGEPPEEVDEVNVNIGNVHFKYVLDEDAE